MWRRRIRFEPGCMSSRGERQLLAVEMSRENPPCLSVSSDRPVFAAAGDGADTVTGSSGDDIGWRPGK